MGGGGKAPQVSLVETRLKKGEGQIYQFHSKEQGYTHVVFTFWFCSVNDMMLSLGKEFILLLVKINGSVEYIHVG